MLGQRMNLSCRTEQFPKVVGGVGYPLVRDDAGLRQGYARRGAHEAEQVFHLPPVLQQYGHPLGHTEGLEVLRCVTTVTAPHRSRAPASSSMSAWHGPQPALTNTRTRGWPPKASVETIDPSGVGAAKAGSGSPMSGPCPDAEEWLAWAAGRDSTASSRRTMPICRNTTSTTTCPHDMWLGEAPAQPHSKVLPRTRLMPIAAVKAPRNPAAASAPAASSTPSRSETAAINSRVGQGWGLPSLRS